MLPGTAKLEFLCKEMQAGSAAWIWASVFNSCYVCIMHKGIAEFLRCSQISCFSCCWSKTEIYCPIHPGSLSQLTPCNAFHDRRGRSLKLEIVTHDTKPSVQGTEPLIFMSKAISKLWRTVERGLLMGRSQLQTPMQEEEGATNHVLPCSSDTQEEITINSFKSVDFIF